MKDKKDNIMNKKEIVSILVNYDLNIISFDECVSLLDENTESVSSTSAQSGDLHGVREWNASDKTDESSDVIVDGTLEKRTETKEVCNCPSGTSCSLDINNILFCTECGKDRKVTN